jgi:cystathionine beta-lyase family protein involved in aluminum resistance
LNLFSERNGYTSSKGIQIDSIDKQLKDKIRNRIFVFYIERCYGSFFEQTPWQNIFHNF